MDIPFYFTFKDASGSRKVVPCINLSEAAMLEFAVQVRGYKDARCVDARYFFISKTKGRRVTSFLREAAEIVKQTRTNYHRSFVAGTPKRYLISATARRILKPTHLRSLNELLKERKRLDA